jgi:tellurite resistance protein TehA-like permease
MVVMNQKALKNLSPANFAFVMSSGSVSLILYKTGWLTLSWLILVIGLFGYLALVSLFTWRVFVIKREILKDFKDIQRMFKYLTFSAGSNGLSVSCYLFGYELIGLILGIAGIISTIFLTYTLFCALFFHIQASIQAISPFWLLLAIACNSSGIVITTFWGKGTISNSGFLLLAFGFWTFGVFIYLIFMTLNLYRMIFFTFDGVDMDPCYWTCMGAAAIAVVDGSLFISTRNPPLFLDNLRPFMEGVILFLWGWGTAWIPILCLMELWKWAYFKVPFRYQPSRWAMVFPFAMYTAATDVLNASIHVDALQIMVQILLWITFVFWCLVLYMSRLNPFSIIL